MRWPLPSQSDSAAVPVSDIGHSNNLCYRSKPESRVDRLRGWNMASKRKTKKTAKKTAKKTSKKTALKKTSSKRRTAAKGTGPGPSPGKLLVESHFTQAFADEFLGPKITCKWMGGHNVGDYMNDFGILASVLIAAGFPEPHRLEVRDTPVAQRLKELIQREGWPSGKSEEALNDSLLCITKLLHCVLVLNNFSWPPHTGGTHPWPPHPYEKWPPHVG
jgi:hypothetical protein